MGLKRMVYQWDDFFGPNGMLGDVVNRKIAGLVEMAICAGGRIFFGTKESTYSSYITRLRGYFDAPDKNTYQHNIALTGNPEIDKTRHKPYMGQIYKIEFPRLWDLKNDEDNWFP